MIELALVFLLGMMVAGMLWLLALPAFWRRAVRLTRRRIERQLPLSLNEIEGEHDRLRAEHAIVLTRALQATRKADESAAAAKAEAGARLQTEATLLERIAALEVEIAGRGEENARLQADIAAREAAIAALSDDAALARASILGLETERDAMRTRFESMTHTAETRRIALDEAETHATRAREALAEETRRNGALMLEVQQLSKALQEAERRIAGSGPAPDMATDLSRSG